MAVLVVITAFVLERHLEMPLDDSASLVIAIFACLLLSLRFGDKF